MKITYKPVSPTDPFISLKAGDVFGIQKGKEPTVFFIKIDTLTTSHAPGHGRNAINLSNGDATFIQNGTEIMRVQAKLEIS